MVGPLQLQKAPEAALTAVPLTTYQGFQSDPSFSPDGNEVAFVWNGEKQDNVDIYVKLIGTVGPPLRLTSDPADDYSPAWSPDGRYVAFLRDLANERADVLLVPALGGPERKVAQISSPSKGSESLASPYLSWTPDSNSLVVADRGSINEPFALFLLSIDTGEEQRLTSPVGHLLGDSCPALSRDGRILAFARIVDAGIGDLYLLPLSDGFKALGTPRELTFGSREAITPSWTADGREIVFAEFTGSGLWRTAAPASTARAAKPRQLLPLGQNLQHPAISRRGDRLTYVHQIYHVSIARTAMPAPVGGSTRAAIAQPLISSSRDDTQPQFSPDGKKITFVSSRSGHPEIWASNSDGLNAVQLTSFGGPFVTTPRWSPNGEKIAFDSNAAGEFDVWVVGASGGKPQRMTTHPANDGDPSWSHDGRWIYFDSARTGEQELFKIPANGGDAVKLTRDGGFAPLESPDGKFLYYTKALFATSVWKIPVEGGQPLKILDGLASYPSFAVVNSGVYFVPSEQPASIRFLSFGTNQVRSVANFQKVMEVSGVGGGLSVSPDGKWMLFTQLDQAGSELMLVESFH